VRDTPISEPGHLGRRHGRRHDRSAEPIAEIMFSDFFAVLLGHRGERDREESLHDHGQLTFPLVIRSGNGGDCVSVRNTPRASRTWAMMIPV